MPRGVPGIEFGAIYFDHVGQSIFTQADDIPSLHEMVRDAVRCHFDDDDPRRPGLIHLHFVKDEVILG